MSSKTVNRLENTNLKLLSDKIKVTFRFKSVFVCYEAAAFVLTGPLKCSKESALVSEVKYFNLPTRLKRDVKMAALGDECPEPSPQANRSDSSRVLYDFRSPWRSAASWCDRAS